MSSFPRGFAAWLEINIPSLIDSYEVAYDYPPEERTDEHVAALRAATASQIAEWALRIWREAGQYDDEEGSGWDSDFSTPTPLRRSNGKHYGDAALQDDMTDEETGGEDDVEDNTDTPSIPNRPPVPYTGHERDIEALYRETKWLDRPGHAFLQLKGSFLSTEPMAEWRTRIVDRRTEGGRRDYWSFSNVERRILDFHRTGSQSAFHTPKPENGGKGQSHKSRQDRQNEMLALRLFWDTRFLYWAINDINKDHARRCLAWMYTRLMGEWRYFQTIMASRQNDRAHVMDKVPLDPFWYTNREYPN